MKSTTNRRRAFVAAAVALASLLAWSSTAPASAEPSQPATGRSAVSVADPFPPGTPGPLKIQNDATKLCLDSSTNGDRRIYYGKCHPSDPGQKWGWFNGGFLIQLTTGMCVGVNGYDQVIGQQVCSATNRAQYWTHRNQAIVNTLYGQCVDSDTEAYPVYMHGCRSAAEHTWWVTYWA